MTAWNAREEAALTLEEILAKKGYSSIVLDRRIQQYPPSVDLRDKALVTRLVYGALTHLNTLDALIDSYSRTPVRRMKPYIACTLRVACEQMLYEDRIPDRAAVYEAVEAVKHSRFKGLSGFVNGVLRAILRDGAAVPKVKDRLEQMALDYSLPAGILQDWEASYGPDMTLDIARRLSTETSVCVRCNTLKCTPEELEAELKKQLGDDAVRRSKALNELFYLGSAEGLGGWKALTEGRMVVQNESAALSAALSLVQPGMKVLDMCAAPGGKSTFMAQRMQNKGTLISCDVHEHKVRLMQAQMERMGITCCQTLQQDGTVFRPEWEETFDVVMLDAPCSGLGILRGKPEIRWFREEGDFDELVLLQEKLLSQAARYVKPGGRLVYSTCTIRAGENEGQMERFLSEYPDFSETDLEKDLPSVAICDTISNNYAKRPEKPFSKGWRVILPEEKGRDGFFLASLVKQA